MCLPLGCASNTEDANFVSRQDLIRDGDEASSKRRSESRN